MNIGGKGGRKVNRKEGRGEGGNKQTFKEEKKIKIEEG